MWIVIDVPGYESECAVVATNEKGQNFLFNTCGEASAWAEKNCAWGYEVVEI